MENIPQFLTIRQVARTGLLPEHAIRQMARQGRLPSIEVGNRCLINYNLLIEQLNSLGEGGQHADSFDR